VLKKRKYQNHNHKTFSNTEQADYQDGKKLNSEDVSKDMSKIIYEIDLKEK